LKIEIENLTFNAIIGLLYFERKNEQKVVVNLTATYLYKDRNYLDYVDICNIIKNSIKTKKFELLEDALNYLGKTIQTKYPQITNLYIKISKPDILDDCIVSLSGEWREWSD